MKLVHVIGSAATRYGGPQRFTRVICRGLADRGHDVTLITTDLDGPNRLDVADLREDLGEHVNIVVCPVRSPRGFAFSPQMVSELSRAAANAHVLHIHGVYQFQSVAGAVVAHRQRMPYVIHVHGALTPYHRRQKAWKKRPYERVVEKRILRQAAAVIHMTESERRSFDRHFDSSSAAIIAAPVDPELFDPSGEPVLPPSLANHRNARLVTFLGRLTKKKGLELLVSAFDRIAGKHPDAHLVIAGPDDDRLGESLIARRDPNNGRGRVTLLGLVEGDAKRNLLRSSAVFVLPSADESFGIAAAEALACGTPTILTPQVALSEELRKAGAALVVEREAEPIARAIDTVLSDPSKAGTLAHAGMRVAQSRFRVEAVCVRLEEIYRHASKSGCAGRGAICRGL